MMGKICFVTLMNLSAVPYLKKYLELIDCKYDVIYWNRYGIPETCGAENHYALEYKIQRNCKSYVKLYGYMRFRQFASRILRNDDYDKVILLSGNVAVLLSSILLKKYRNKYIVDIRDFFKENNKFYYEKEKIIIDNSLLTVISSKAYEKFLPKHNYIVVHNSPTIEPAQFESYKKHRNAFLEEHHGYPIIVSFIGGVRFVEQDKKILRYFGNDDRFIVRYIGVGADLLRAYCETENITNAYFHDRFPPEQTLSYYADTDFILNLYGSGTPLLDYALSNKLYYAAELGIPILVCPGTYMAEIAVTNGFGIAISLDDPTDKDQIVRMYKNRDSDSYKACGKAFLDIVEKENEFWRQKISVTLRTVK